MNTRKHNIKRSIVTLSCLLFSVGAMAQAYSSGGGSATGYFFCCGMGMPSNWADIYCLGIL